MMSPGGFPKLNPILFGETELIIPDNITSDHRDTYEEYLPLITCIKTEPLDDVSNEYNSSIELPNHVEDANDVKDSDEMSLDDDYKQLQSNFRVCYVCKHVTESFYHLRNHLRQHSPMKSFECGKCDYVGATPNNLSKHDLIHTIKSEHLAFKCCLCNFSTRKRKNLDHHYEIYHQSMKSVLTSKRDIKNQEENFDYLSQPSYCHICYICEYRTESYHHLRQHLKHHSTSESFECDKCDYVSRTNRYLIKHINEMHDAESQRLSFPCCVCNFSTTCDSYLETHYGQYHRSVTDVLMKKLPLRNCHICEYRSESYFYLRHHFIGVHSTLKVYNCDKCDYVGSTRHNLTKHALMHRLKPQILTYKCGVCNFSTIHSENLQNHFTMFHRSIVQLDSNKNRNFKNAQKITCSKCDVAFKRLRYLKEHCTNARTVIDKKPLKRRKFRCHFCVFHTKYQDEFKSHLLRNHKTKSVKCHHCHECFEEISDFYQHIVTSHRYCKLCKVSFHTTWDLLRHQSIHTRNCNVSLEKLPHQLAVSRVRVCYTKRYNST